MCHGLPERINVGQTQNTQLGSARFTIHRSFSLTTLYLYPRAAQAAYPHEPSTSALPSSSTLSLSIDNNAADFPDSLSVNSFVASDFARADLLLTITESSANRFMNSSDGSFPRTDKRNTFKDVFSPHCVI